MSTEVHTLDPRYSTQLPSIGNSGVSNLPGKSVSIQDMHEGCVEKYFPLIDGSGDLQSPSGGNAVPGDIICLLPQALSACVETIEREEKQTPYLLGSLAAISSCMREVRGDYQTHWYHPHLNLIVYGPPGSGKGVVDTSTQLVRLVDRRLRADAAPQEESDESSTPRLLVPANASHAALIEALDANGGNGYMTDSEVDTLVDAVGQDWGNHSHMIRKAAEHEEISSLRISSGSFEIEHPTLAIMLAGTPGQIGKLIPSAENGLFSRFGFYYLEGSSDWISGRPSPDSLRKRKVRKHTAERIDDLHKQLSSRSEPLNVQLNADQWAFFDGVFREVKKWSEAEVGPSFAPSVHRSGVRAFRIAMVLSVLRHQENGFFEYEDQVGEKAKIFASDRDVYSGVSVALILLDHAARLYSRLPGEETTLRGAEASRQLFLEELPDEFETSDALRIGKDELDLAQRTVYKYLSTLCENKKLKQLKHGKYEKSAAQSRFGTLTEEDSRWSV